MVKGAVAYLEGRLSLDEWTGQDGARRQGLSVMARYCRLPQIGRNKPKRERPEKKAAATCTGTTGTDADLDDQIPF
jgi:single-stranded DNA-binding protein